MSSTTPIIAGENTFQLVMFLVTVIVSVLQIFLLAGIDSSKVIPTGNTAKVIIWTACSFTAFFTMITVVVTIAAFLIALYQLVTPMPVFGSLFSVLVLLCIGFGSVHVHNIVMRGARERGLVKSG